MVRAFYLFSSFNFTQEGGGFGILGCFHYKKTKMAKSANTRSFDIICFAEFALIAVDSMIILASSMESQF